MIDPREPKNGDFASYVESLVSAPKAQQLPDAPATGWGHGSDATAQDASPGAVPGRFPRQAARPDGGATRPDATRLDGGATRRDAGGARPNAGATRPDAGAVGNVMRRVATLISFFGAAVILLSFVDNPPFFADPAFGILLIAAGAFVNRFLRKPR